MGEVGLSPKALELYPHEFSGGQRQRIGLARALALDPKLIVADEPVSALDVSIQAQILNLLKELQQRRYLTYIFISHDLAVVKYMADTIGVMYLGKLVEVGPALDIYERAAHPYTRALIDTIPEPDPARARDLTGQAHQGGAALGHAAALGLPVPHPLPLRPGGLRRGGTTAAALRDRHFAACHFPLQTPTGSTPRRHRGVRSTSLTARFGHRCWSRTSRESRSASPTKLKATTTMTMHNPAG